MPQIVLFDSPEALQRLSAAANALTGRSDDRKLYRLGQMLSMIASNAADFDQHCQMNVEWSGAYLLDRLSDVKRVANGEISEIVTALVYRFLLEYDLSVKNRVSSEMRVFMDQVRADGPSMSDEARILVEPALLEMPIAILKRMISSDEIGNLRNVSTVAATIEGKIDRWHKELEETEKKATNLGAILENQAQAFNFVGLHHGFSDLLSGIIEELWFARGGITLFGLLVLLPSAFDLWLVLGNATDLSRIAPHTLLAVSVGTVTLTLLFLYFFRIALRKADSCQAQLGQVRLRMSLCRFIQSYADYSTGIKEKNPDALAKFEALIFSGIVGSEDKLPSTFDGIEQLSALAKSIRGN
jgi:hypothetical protein